MCGRFALSAIPKPLLEAFGLRAFGIQPRFNIAPTQNAVAILRDNENGNISPQELHWGLVPFWAKDKSNAARAINARAETADQKPTFRAAFRHRRCLIPATGFYEWRREGKTKTPFYFTPADRDNPLVFAGLWEEWTDHVEILHSFTILTTEANADMQSVHDRMPVIIQPNAWEKWLNPAVQGRKELDGILRPCAEGFLQKWVVGAYVNKAGNEGETCIKPVA